MKTIKIYGILWLLFLLLTGSKKLQDLKYIDVRIFHQVNISSIEASPCKGNYILYSAEGVLDTFFLADVLKAVKINQTIAIYKNHKKIAQGREFYFIEEYDGNEFNISVNGLSKMVRTYTDNLKIKIHPVENSLLVVNHVDLDRYSAAVAEAEGGKSNLNEYYKVQVVLCRTYALRGLRRHEGEGFQLCDRVHCQVYHGKVKSNKILLAAKETRGLVITDEKYQLIDAAFHSNCGGITANAEEVWTYPTPYLRSVQDSFCLQGNNACWRKEISLNEWKKYLQQKCGLINDSLWMNYTCSDIARKTWIMQDSCRVAKSTVRQDLGLKSALFSVSAENGKIIFNGRGFGHGVGLCQEGAMVMARKGYTFSEIINYYYTGVKIINIEYLDYFAMDE